MTVPTATLHNPVAAPASGGREALAPRLSMLQGAVVGIIDNRRPEAAGIAQQLVVELTEVHGVSEAPIFRKPSVAHPAPFLEEVAQSCDAVINQIADLGAVMAATPYDSVALERLGCPTVSFCSNEVVDVFRVMAARYGIPNVPVIGVPSVRHADTATSVARFLKENRTRIAEFLTTNTTSTSAADPIAQRAKDADVRVEISNSLEGLHEALTLFATKDWTDGLPIVPPTVELVRDVMDKAGVAPEEKLGELPPFGGVATVEKVAVNSVMAGAGFEQLPVIIAAVRAVAHPDFHLGGLQLTTNPAAPLVIVSGDAATRAGMNSGGNLFGGASSSANGAIGRAVQLCVQNIGGASPARFDMATQGHPGKYTYAIAEQAVHPWSTFAQERGYGAGAVTVLAAEAPHNVNALRHRDPESVLSVAANAMANIANNHVYYPRSEALLVLGPDHARICIDAGWSRDDVRRYIHNNARVPLGAIRSMGGMWGVQMWPKWYPQKQDDAMVPILEDPDRLLIIVGGGPGNHYSWVPIFGHGSAQTVPVEV